MERMSTNRPLSDYPPRTSVPPPPPPPAALPEYQPASVAPPPVQVPSEPPRAPRKRDGSLWLRTLGVIVLSASVGAVVSSLTSEVKSKLEPAAVLGNTSIEAHRASVASPLCTTTAQSLESKPILASASLSESSSTPRISVHALPLQHGSRREASVERRRDASDETSAERGRETYADRRQEVTPARTNLDGAAPKSKRNVAPPAPPPPRELPDQPSRTEVTNAVRRAASGAMSCDSGPQDGTVTVTFAPSGAVQSVSLVKGFGDATLNACVLRAFGRARVPAFSGDPVKVRKTITW
jgi:hypothetical protein